VRDRVERSGHCSRELSLSSVVMVRCLVMVVSD
jgi:hypothetical protein